MYIGDKDRKSSKSQVGNVMVNNFVTQMACGILEARPREASEKVLSVFSLLKNIVMLYT